MNRDLPLPDTLAAAHSQTLRQHVMEAIKKQGGVIPFSQFMQLALYAPGLGYYSAGSHKLGEAGDFVTAPEISPLFGASLAKAISPALQQLPNAAILEVGAGSGALAASMLTALNGMGYANDYFILEVSADLRERQQQRLRVAGQTTRVKWLESMPHDFIGVVIANELLDAMPVVMFEITEHGVMERCVAVQDDQFVWCLQAPSDPRLIQRIVDIEARLGECLPTGYVSEVNLAAEDWIQSLSVSVQQGYALLIDYGFPRHEYYHPQRKQGTLMCHYRHHSHPDPFQFIGLQDVTAHIDFSAMAEAALASGWSVAGYTTQAHFLMASGLMELLPQDFSEVTPEQLTLQAEVKKLTLPHEMGELFKVLGLQKNCAITLPGFQLRDLRDRL